MDIWRVLASLDNLCRSVPDANWWRGFLRGRARAFTRQNVTLTAVAGAITGAQREGVSDSEINEILKPFGLAWDGVNGRVVLTGPRRVSS